MTQRELAALVLKMLGVYALIESLQWIRQVMQLIETFRQGQGPEVLPEALWMSLSVLSPFLAMVGVGVVLLFFSRWIARIVVGADADARISSSVSGRHIQAIGLSVVAVFVTFQAMPNVLRLTWTLWYLFGESATGRMYASLVKNAVELGVSVGIQLGLAALLFFSSRGLAKAWHRGVPDRPARGSREGDAESATSGGDQ